MTSYLIENVRSKFPDAVLEAHSFRGDETVVVKKEALADVAAFLRDSLGFDMLMDLTAADYLPREPRFELVCHFYSTRHNYRLRLKCPVGGEQPSAASLTPLWPGANWFEREVWDMYGIRFEGHPDLRRVLMYDGFEGHPLRKDYPLKKRQPRIAHRD
ncbi:MAG: NADH dehydrogenase [Elusimicrobia bacterium GWA2_64_40]|nr:MAG: NADH dehydrogenase [Elusimicrobia bacterium GWA2_64_40]OGR65303.1 MAG: NADH dehydrogenase [Elusimicrobia bacterium GWB2_63_16]HAN04316.1 NADH-quinone oxidoreductase subunit C [Elusimicrobiota bacterium]